MEDAKAVLSAHFTEHMTLDELGREVNVSPFHLARSFRRHTGYTLHEYRTHLRLRAALDGSPWATRNWPSSPARSAFPATAT